MSRSMMFFSPSTHHLLWSKELWEGPIFVTFHYSLKLYMLFHYGSDFFVVFFLWLEILHAVSLWLGMFCSVSLWFGILHVVSLWLGIVLPLPIPCLTATGKVRFYSNFLSRLQYYYYYRAWLFTPRSLITSQQINILTWNFQSMFLRVKEHHSWNHESPRHPFCKSWTLNILQVTPFLTHFQLRYQ